jgi:hypothetical protein
MLVRLKEAADNIPAASRKEFIPFPKIFEKIGRTFYLTKPEIWNYLIMFNELGFIKILRCKGIKLNFEVENG